MMNEPQTIPPVLSGSSVSLPNELKSSLQQVQSLLHAHAAHVSSRLLAELPALLESFGKQHVRIAVCGEVKAGKSTLLNAIAGADLSPVAFEPLTNVAVRITHGATTVWRVGSQTVDGLAELEQAMRRGTTEKAEVVVETNLDLLQLGGQVELLDTPGLGSDARMDSVSAEALRSLDAIILVVRYPALFTEFTRQLVRGLSHDISKLFVVWNLDGSCRDLGDAERARHTDTLRANLAGAYEVFFVDAHMACTTRSADPDNSGLWYLTSALHSFLGSHSREVVALREAAKRGQQLVAGAQESLSSRQAMVQEVIAAARRHIADIEATARAHGDSARTRLAEQETTAEAIVARSRAEANTAATKLRQALGAAARRWMWSGNLSALDASVSNVLEEYADTVARSSNAAADEMQAAANALGASCSLLPRPVTIPYIADLAPGGRGTLATTGNWQLLRRTLWRGWYLEGLSRLRGEVIEQDIEQQGQWLQGAREQTALEGRQATERKLEKIKEQAAAATAQVVEETDLLAYEAEARQLEQDLPALAAESHRLNELAARARGDQSA